MSIPVNCSCGKAFKVAEHLAGKAVKCPACKGPLRIPGGPPGKTGPQAESHELDEARKQEALLRFEAAQRRKTDSAEAEATYRDEQNKLIESYDQLAGKSGKEKGKKRELAGEKKRKATIFMKLHDALAIVWGTLLVRYLVIVGLVAGGALGSVYLVRYVTGYMTVQTAPSDKPKDEQIQEQYKKFDEAFATQRWSAARDALEEVLRIDPTKHINREFTARRQKLLDATSK